MRNEAGIRRPRPRGAAGRDIKGNGAHEITSWRPSIRLTRLISPPARSCPDRKHPWPGRSSPYLFPDCSRIRSHRGSR